MKKITLIATSALAAMFMAGATNPVAVSAATSSTNAKVFSDNFDSYTLGYTENIPAIFNK